MLSLSKILESESLLFLPIASDDSKMSDINSAGNKLANLNLICVVKFIHLRAIE